MAAMDPAHVGRCWFPHGGNGAPGALATTLLVGVIQLADLVQEEDAPFGGTNQALPSRSVPLNAPRRWPKLLSAEYETYPHDIASWDC